ncbi:hypothetical protein ACFHYQ_20315 [Sphaerimonospora cavernae]|uniref:Uncharacterized protein n=1 Tax=Sphaerimonospora cavernae TaxID=1740611 RepID=A0ABV6U857_9ACTN
MQANDKDHLRISADVIARSVWAERKAALWAARLMLGIITFSLASANLSRTFGVLGGIIAVCAGCLITWCANGSHLLQLGAELSARFTRFPRSIFRRGARKYSIVQAAEILPGDWVCSQSEYERQCAPTRKANKERRQRHHERIERDRDWERERYVHDMKRWEMDLERGYSTSPPRAPSTVSSHCAPEDWADPFPDFLPVVAIIPSVDGESLQLTRLGCDPYCANPEEIFLRRDRYSTLPLRESSSLEGRLIEDLLLKLSEEGEVSEAQILAQFSERGHEAPIVLHAIRALLVAKLTTRRRNLYNLPLELLAIIRFLNISPSRHLKLSTIGKMWVEANKYRPQRRQAKVMTEGKYVFLGDIYGSNIGDHGSVYNVSTTVDYGLIGRLVTVLDSAVDRFSDTADPQGLQEALEVLRAATKEGEVPIPKLRRAMIVVARVGEGLIVGMAGNALFEQLKHAISSMAG